MFSALLILAGLAIFGGLLLKYADPLPGPEDRDGRRRRERNQLKRAAEEWEGKR